MTDGAPVDSPPDEHVLHEWQLTERNHWREAVRDEREQTRTRWVMRTVLTCSSCGREETTIQEMT
jgi:hypothetical protein